jgi:lysozyme
MTPSLRCVAIIQAFEGYSPGPMPDQAGVMTIGFGHTVGVTAETPSMTREEAVAQLFDDMAEVSQYVTKVVGVVPQYVFDAFCSFAFNIGLAGFRSSTVLREHLAGNHSAAIAGFLLWDDIHVDGVLTQDPGLLNRRINEAALYQGILN